MASVEGRSRPPTRELPPLETAARDGDTAEFLDLLGGADEAQGLSLALFLAAKAGALEIVEALLASGRRFGPGPSGRTALFVAITHGHMSVIEALAASPLFADEPFSSAEVTACVTEHRPAALRLLLTNRDRFQESTLWPQRSARQMRHQRDLLPLAFRHDRKRLPEAPFTRALLGFSVDVARIVLCSAIDLRQRWAVDLAMERYPGGEALPLAADVNALHECLAKSTAFGWVDIVLLLAEVAGESLYGHAAPVVLVALKEAKDAATLRALLAHPLLRRAALWQESAESQEKCLMETYCVRSSRKRYQPLLECLVDELSAEELRTVVQAFFPELTGYAFSSRKVPKPTTSWVARVLAHAQLDGRMVQADALQLLLDRVATPADLGADDPVGQLVCSVLWNTRYTYGAARNAVDQHQKATLNTLNTLLHHPAVPPLTSQHVLLAVQRAAQTPSSPKLWILQTLLECKRVAPLSRSDREALIAGVEEVAPSLLPLAIKWGGWSRRGPLILLRSLVATERASPCPELDPVARFLVCAAPRQVFRVATQFL